MKRHGIWADIRERRHRELYRLSDLVGACTYRYLRMLNKGARITVAQWNGTIFRVAKRCCLNPWPVKSALYVEGDGTHDHTWAVIPPKGERRPTYVLPRYWWRGTAFSRSRLELMRNARAQRIELERKRESLTCQGCGFVAESLSVTGVYSRFDACDGLTYAQAYKAKTRYCVACWNRLRPVFRIRAEAEELKRLTNQLKKVIHEKAA